MSDLSKKEMTVAKSEIFDTSSYAEEQSGSKFKRKFKESPFMVIGVLGSIGVLAYGIRSFKKRTLSPSIFIMQLRVATQGAVVGMLTLGCCYQLYKRLTFKDELHHPEDKKGR